MAIRFLAIGLIAGMLAACSGSGDPKPTPSPTAPPSTSASTSKAPSPSPSRTGPLTTGPNVRPGERPPVLPELAKEHTANGALVFAGYYFKAYDWGYATNDGYLVRSISSPACKACQSYLNGLASLNAGHEQLTGGRITIRSASIRKNEFRIRAEYVADVSVEEESVVLRGPSEIRTAAPAVHNLRSLVFLEWFQSRWRVAEVTKP